MATGTWIGGNRALNDEEMQNNAGLFYINMTDYGFTLNAIAGMLGNIQSESWINPQVWEDLIPNRWDTNGYGLVQWTPASKLREYADLVNLPYDSGDTQVSMIDWEFRTGRQYSPTSTYPLSASEFKNSEAEPEYLAAAFEINYERHAGDPQIDRQTQARFWYEFLSDFHPTKRKRKMPLWMYLPFWT